METKLVCLRCNTELQRYGVASVPRGHLIQEHSTEKETYLTSQAHLFLCPECGHIELFHPVIGLEKRYGLKKFELEDCLDEEDFENEPDGWVCPCGFSNDPTTQVCANCGEPWDPNRRGRFDA